MFERTAFLLVVSGDTSAIPAFLRTTMFASARILSETLLPFSSLMFREDSRQSSVYSPLERATQMMAGNSDQISMKAAGDWGNLPMSWKSATVSASIFRLLFSDNSSVISDMF